VSETDVISLVAVIASMVAAVSSSLLAWRALRLNRNANHLPIIVDLFAQHRSPEFVEKEEYIWEHIHEHKPSLGFAKLPSPIKNYAIEVALFYLMFGYLSEYEIVERELIALQAKYRVIKTWEALEGHVMGERTLRGGEYTFLNTLEIFVDRVKSLDAQAIATRMRNE
jgi:hypothetical protein